MEKRHVYTKSGWLASFVNEGEARSYLLMLKPAMEKWGWQASLTMWDRLRMWKHDEETLDITLSEKEPHEER